MFRTNTFRLMSLFTMIQLWIFIALPFIIGGGNTPAYWLLIDLRDEVTGASICECRIVALCIFAIPAFIFKIITPKPNPVQIMAINLTGSYVEHLTTLSFVCLHVCYRIVARQPLATSTIFLEFYACKFLHVSICRHFDTRKFLHEYGRTIPVSTEKIGDEEYKCENC